MRFLSGWKYLIILVICSVVVLAVGAVPRVGDRVLAMREGTNSFFAATVKSAETEDGNTSGSVKFDDGTEQEYGPISFEPSLRPFDWRVGSRIECGASAQVAVDAGDAESSNLTAGTISALTATTIELTDAAGRKASFPLSGCRYHRTWWDELAEKWRNYAKYPSIAAMPASGSATPTATEIQSIYSSALESMDGGSYIQLKKCVVTGRGWSRVTSGSELLARQIEAACAIAIPLPPRPQENFTCIVEYGVCKQPYLGDNQFGDCEWHYSATAANQIACAAIR